jgi:hypothetical protein
MDISIEVNKIKRELEDLHDENLIETIKTLLSFARQRIYESGIKPISVEEYKNRALKSEEDIKMGGITDIHRL